MTVARRLTCFKNKTCNILGFMEIIVYKIQPVGGWGYTISIPGSNGCSIKLNHNLLHMRIKSSLKTHARPSSETRRLMQAGKPQSRAQWLSGRVLDPRPRGHRSKFHRRHCVVSLNKNIIPTLVLAHPGRPVPI